MVENWSAYHSDGWELFAGYQGTRAACVEAVMRWALKRGEYFEIVGSKSGEWRVGPRGGVRREVGR